MKTQIKNDMVITKLEYKFFEKDPYLELSISGFSGSFNEKTQETAAGTIYNSTVAAYVPNINETNDVILYGIMDRKAILRITDSANIIHEIGNDSARVPLDIEKINEGKPGSKHGYNLKINYQYHKPAKLIVL